MRKKKVYFDPNLKEPKKTRICKECGHRDILKVDILTMIEILSCNLCKKDICVNCIVSKASADKLIYICYECFLYNKQE